MTYRCKHLEAIKDELRAAGVTGITTKRTKRSIIVSGSLRDQPIEMSIGAKTRDDVGATKQNRQRLLRRYPELRP